MKQFFLFILLSPLLLAAQHHRRPSIQKQVWCITEVMYHDVTTPTAAARFYAYATLAGYEIISQLDPAAYRFQSKLNAYPAIQFNAHAANVDKQLAVLYGILETGKQMLPSGYLLDEKQDALLNDFLKNGISKDKLEASVLAARKISAQIVQYAKTDGYFKLSTFPRYRPYQTDSAWRPTPPEYMAAVDPHWNRIRTFFLDSAQQFKPQLPVFFNKSETSDFYKLTKEVYDVTNQLSNEQKLIANFWDCNPFAVQFRGHMSIGLKKISPGGHWMGITGIACEKAELDFDQTMLLHTLVALTLHDAFISCWDEKYRSNRIRPETAINRYIDERWKPILQTPPFPEYSSGHSVISTAASEVLSWFLGDDFNFTDTTETYIGLPARTFNSFREAAAEARISRLFGGIHFRDAIEQGGVQGKKVGEFIIDKLKLKSRFSQKKAINNRPFTKLF